LVFVTILLILAMVESPRSQEPEEARQFELEWWTVDGGGGASSGGGYQLGAVIGQPDAGVHAGGDYELEGGFWPGVSPLLVFADGFESGDTSRWSQTVD
jgi:hypothetical protein